MTPLAPDLSAFLQTHLPDECGASRHTIAAYARAFTLLLRFVAGRVKRTPSELFIEDLDIQTIRAFLEHIEEGRANSVRSRNARLAAIKSFFRFVEHRQPACRTLDAVDCRKTRHSACATAQLRHAHASGHR